MISREPTLERLVTAQQPGVEQGHLDAKAAEDGVEAIYTHG